MATPAGQSFIGLRLFVYVNKAQNGPFAPSMHVFEKTDGGNLALLYGWPVSTGRERDEVDARGHAQSSETPAGYYEFHAKRLYVKYASSQWGE